MHCVWAPVTGGQGGELAGLPAVNSTWPAAPSNVPLFASLSGINRTSLIIAVIWGELSPQVLRESKKEVSLTYPPRHFVHSDYVINTSFLLG